MTEIQIATTTGRQVGLNADAIKQLRSGLRGAALLQGEVGYDAARKIYNAMIDRRPAAIARCAEAADVISAVNHHAFSPRAGTSRTCVNALLHSTAPWVNARNARV